MREPNGSIHAKNVKIKILKVRNCIWIQKYTNNVILIYGLANNTQKIYYFHEHAII